MVILLLSKAAYQKNIEKVKKDWKLCGIWTGGQEDTGCNTERTDKIEEKGWISELI